MSLTCCVLNQWLGLGGLFDLKLMVICFVQCYLQHTHAPYWPRLHNMGEWTVAIHTPLSAMAPSVTLTVMRVSGWEEHQLWHATTPATGVRIYPPASVSAQYYLKLTSFVFLCWYSNNWSNVSNYNLFSFPHLSGTVWGHSCLVFTPVYELLPSSGELQLWLPVSFHL